jgi:predicted DsbA family dithiol-disulfide isomerase
MPRYPNTKVIPKEFEIYVMDKFISSYPTASIVNREDIKGTDGNYNIDITIRFNKLDVNFLVLVECKYHNHPIKREYVQLLRDKIVSLGAQKGILVASNSFQSGAINYAKTHGIALVRLINEQFAYETRSREMMPLYYEEKQTLNSKAIIMKLVESTGETSFTMKSIDDFQNMI